MKKVEIKEKRRLRRKRVIRKKIYGTATKPRLSVFRSNRYIYVQAIDDEKGHTIACCTSLTYDSKDNKLNKKTAAKIGEDIANKLKAMKIEEVVFDGKSIKQGKGRINKKNGAEDKGPEGVF